MDMFSSSRVNQFFSRAVPKIPREDEMDGYAKSFKTSVRTIFNQLLDIMVRFKMMP